MKKSILVPKHAENWHTVDDSDVIKNDDNIFWQLIHDYEN